MATNVKVRRMVAAVLFSCVLAPWSSFTQSSESEEFRAYIRLDYWHVKYRVEIKGKGRVEPELGSGGPETEWTVNRIYTGTSFMDRSPGLDLRWSGPPTQKMSIHDKVVRTSDPTCEEYTVETQTWDYEDGGLVLYFGNFELIEAPGWSRIGARPADWPDANSFIGHTVTLAVDYCPFKLVKGLPVDLPRPLVYQKATAYQPRGPVKNEPPEIKPKAFNFRIPNVPDWISSGRLGSGAIRRERKPFPDFLGRPFEFGLEKPPPSKTFIDKNNKPVTRITYTLEPIPRLVNGRFEFDSGELPIPETLLEGIDTRNEATVHITYTLTPAGTERRKELVVVRTMTRKDGEWVFTSEQ